MSAGRRHFDRRGVAGRGPPERGGRCRAPLIFNEPLHNSGASGTNYTAVDLARAASDIAPGAILRWTVAWEGVEPYCLDALGQHVTSRVDCSTPGPYAWNWNDMQSDLDSISSYLSSGQIRLLPVVAYAPAWAWGVGDTADSSVSMPDMPPGGDSTALSWWQKLNTALVTWLEGRYGKASVAGLEVWNEEDNYPVSWSLEPNDPTTKADRYSQVLCSAYSGVRAADSSLPVLFGGFNPTDATYLQDAYSSPLASIKGCMTAIGIHPYNSITDSQGDKYWYSPDDSSAPFMTGPGDVSRVATAAGDGGRPLWITEFGYPTSNAYTAPGQPITEQEQADWDSEAYSLAPTLPDVQPLPAANELQQAVSGDPNAQATC